MNTKFALLARFGSPVVGLLDISEEFFGMKKRTVQDKVYLGEFPVPVIRLSERSPLLVHIDDLSDFIDSKLDEARKKHAAMEH